MFNSKSFCCSRMNFSMNGDRRLMGFYITVTTDEVFHTGLVFVLEARSINEDDEGRILGTLGVPIAAVYKVHIQYCPWCGTRLNTYYSRYTDSLTIVPGAE